MGFHISQDFRIDNPIVVNEATHYLFPEPIGLFTYLRTQKGGKLLNVATIKGCDGRHRARRLMPPRLKHMIDYLLGHMPSSRVLNPHHGYQPLVSFTPMIIELIVFGELDITRDRMRT
jgi:hypothetical protein